MNSTPTPTPKPLAVRSPRRPTKGIVKFNSIRIGSSLYRLACHFFAPTVLPGTYDVPIPKAQTD